MKKIYSLLIVLLLSGNISAIEREKLNFNGGWLMQVGDFPEAQSVTYKDKNWKKVTLPYAFNRQEAFRVSIENLSDTIIWYRKHFTINEIQNRKYFIEFEGVRFAADFYLNGHHIGLSENGVMASGYDLTPFIKKGKNVLAVRVDNDWNYHERATNQRYQWNDKNFNANYGGITKNVWLHQTDLLYQTLPLYSNLGTTGVYVYGTDYDTAGKQVTVHAESQVRNEDSQARTFVYACKVLDANGKEVAHFKGKKYTLQPGETTSVNAKGVLHHAHFWSWGYGYLYTVKTVLQNEDGSPIDENTIRTGFRKTQFGEGKIWLNDRCMMVHGYAQRTSNEWPGVGIDIPAWLSDYSNRLMVESGGNVVRWMHVTPSKQDVESCDRVGLIQAMPAGDAEKDVTGRRWEQRKLLMRDAIIYNRNNPSILFYEGGNESISREHMIELRQIRDTYDPNGGRAIGSREMLDIAEAEYGGEMLYINKSATHPMWSMEYHRDEGLRKYWDDESYPYHKEGDGPLYRGKPALEYNHNMDSLAVSMVKRWYEYFIERPGTGKRVSSGGVKIVFSDTNTHHRGEANYRTSGVTDAMRIPKDSYFAHQVMWNGWVTPEQNGTYIIGHWNYPAGTVKTEYVVSTGDEVELFLNGKSLGRGKRSDEYLFTFQGVHYEAGKLEAVSYIKGKEVSRYTLETAGKPDHIKLTPILNPLGFKADGADVALVDVEIVDAQGHRCPLDNRMITFTQKGEGEWIGGIAMSNNKQNTVDNFINSMTLPVECGINRIMVRSTTKPGILQLTASADGMQPVSLKLQTESIDQQHYNPGLTLASNLKRGETPNTPSYTDIRQTVAIVGVEAGSNAAEAALSYDDNELTEWKSDGKLENAWITYQLEQQTAIDEITLKLTGWRDKYYPLAIYADGKEIWRGWTYPTLGYVHINIDKPVSAKAITIKMLGNTKTQKATGDTAELAGGKADTFQETPSAKGKTELRIVDIDFLYGMVENSTR
ncbi:glycoside hydrolase family 2 protein [Segatella bryantii]|uniref:glycoside hydrolase family 2 protein n=1 Tax=Segatella bryantii TaxID=77095 RepID=UPI002479360D|nr:DUF4982 domain-containing protein [Segatella bryantii]